MARCSCCVLLAVLAAAAAGSAAAQELALARPAGDCLSPALTSLSGNFFPSTYQLQSIQAAPAASGLSTTVEFASDFSVTYYGTYKVVRNTRAGETYLLYQCGTPNPSSAATELDLPPGTKVFEVPLVSVAVTDSNAAAFLAELGLLDRVAFASQYSYNPCLQAINVCGGSAVSASNDSSAAWEQLAAAQQPRVDAILTGDKAANPKSVAITAYADPGVLNRAEWVKFAAVFFNKEVEANRLFGSIAADYRALNASARAAAASASAPVKVAWVSKYEDALTLSFATYKTQLMTDAGGVLPAASDVVAAGGVASPSGGGANFVFNASIPAQRDGFLSILQGVDVIFDDSYAPSSSNLLDMAAFTDAYGAGSEALPAVTSGRVYAFNNRLSKSADDTVGSDWFETSVARPDLVLADFVLAITPSAAPAAANDAGPTWLRKLPSGLAASSVDSLSFSRASDCTLLKSGAGEPERCVRATPARICPNAFRDCATGELKTVTDPNQRCSAATTCAEPAGPPAASPAAAQPKNAAAGSSVAVRLAAAAGALGAMVALL